jgi:Mrp family chromosome partitioning ATPase
MLETELSALCEGLLLRVFQHQREQDRGCVVALTSPHPGVGVTQITNALAYALNRDGDARAMSLCCRQLNSGSSLDGIQGHLSTALNTIRQRYTYSFIDCGSISESQDLMRLAPLVDGVILVVEANRTQKEQISYAERTIESVHGRLLGHVLNKRTYPIPNWCHRMMVSVGL